MATNPQEDTVPAASVPPEGGTGASDAADELRSRMASLKAKVEDAVKRREDQAKQKQLEESEEAKVVDQLREREDRVAEDSRLLPLLQEALHTLADFQSQMERRLVTDKKDVEEFEQLKGLLRALMHQRDEAVSAAESMEKNVVEKLTRSLDEFLKQVEDAEKHRADLEEQRKELEKERVELQSRVDAVISGAVAKLGTGHEKVSAVLGAAETFKNNGEYVASLQQQRKAIGWFQFKEKSALGAVLAQARVFKELDEKKQAMARAVSDIEKINAQIAEMIQQYKEYIVESEQSDKTEVL